MTVCVVWKNYRKYAGVPYSMNNMLYIIEYDNAIYCFKVHIHMAATN